MLHIASTHATGLTIPTVPEMASIGGLSGLTLPTMEDVARLAGHTDLLAATPAKIQHEGVSYARSDSGLLLPR